MKTARKLEQNVADELEWDARLGATPIGVSATDDGVVSLTGHVASIYEKSAAETAAKRVRGVKAVANELEVKPNAPDVRDDAEIAQAAVAALEWTDLVPAKHIQVTVSGGWLTLDGEVKWQFQKQWAEGAVSGLGGVRGVTNRIIVKSQASTGQVKEQIEAALERNARLDAHGIKVEMEDGTVTLLGKVKSWAEKDEAEQAAWFAPGVKDVENLLEVREPANDIV